MNILENRKVYFLYYLLVFQKLHSINLISTVLYRIFTPYVTPAAPPTSSPSRAWQGVNGTLSNPNHTSVKMNIFEKVCCIKNDLIFFVLSPIQ